MVTRLVPVSTLADHSVDLCPLCSVYFQGQRSFCLQVVRERYTHYQVPSSLYRPTCQTRASRVLTIAKVSPYPITAAAPYKGGHRAGRLHYTQGSSLLTGLRDLQEWMRCQFVQRGVQTDHPAPPEIVPYPPTPPAPSPGF